MENKPGQYISIKLNVDLTSPDKTSVIVRRIDIDDTEKVSGVFGLNASGEWKEKVEGGKYADECILPCEIYQAAYGWDAEQINGNFDVEMDNGKPVWSWNGGNTIAISDELVSNSEFIHLKDGYILAGPYQMAIKEYDPFRGIFIATRLQETDAHNT
jgi:hypothetical protein